MHIRLSMSKRNENENSFKYRIKKSLNASVKYMEKKLE